MRKVKLAYLTWLPLTAGVLGAASESHREEREPIEELLADHGEVTASVYYSRDTAPRAVTPRAGSYELPLGREMKLRIAEGAGILSDFEVGGIRPTALASGDLDEDGVPDLVRGFAGPDGGSVLVHRGNIETFFDDDAGDESRFHAADHAMELPGVPEFLAVGDFDNDGHADVVATHTGDRALYVLPGDGRGQLGAARRMALPGTVTSMASGHINRPDGIADVVVGIQGENGPAVLVFENAHGALAGPPETIALPEAARGLALGQFVDDANDDLIIAAGSTLRIVSGRDRRITLNAKSRALVALPAIRAFEMTDTIVSVALTGRVGQQGRQRGVAVLLEDGTLQILDNEGTIVEAGTLPAPAARGYLHAARLSGRPTEELLVLDPAGRRLHLFRGAEAESSAGSVAALSRTTRQLQTAPVALLSLRLGTDPWEDLLVLDERGTHLHGILNNPQATITVNSTADSAVSGDRACTLREAIANANADADTTGGDCAAGAGNDMIAFAIASGPQSIAMTGALPAISDPLVIDGTTQPGFTTTPIIQLDGTAAGAGVAGLVVNAGSSTIRGLVINRFDEDGLLLDLNGGNFVEGNFIGTDLSGTLDLGNGGSGILVQSSGNTIGGTLPGAGNLISGNEFIGVLLIGADDNDIQGNRIGLERVGTSAIANLFGIVTDDSDLNRIGGATDGSRNVIGGNTWNGVHVELSTANLVQGNHIGIDGNDPAPNTNFGVICYLSDGNTVGGTAEGAGNVISENQNVGVTIGSTNAANNNLIQGNIIGLGENGIFPRGNLHGVWVENSPGNVVGGAVAGAGNLISENGHGIVVLETLATGNQIQGNLIGYNAHTGANNGIGIIIQDAPNNIVGGTTVAERNVISGSFGDQIQGINLFGSDASGNQILGNYIGTDPDGIFDFLGHDEAGIHIEDAPDNIIGGSADGAGNLIVANHGDGVLILGGSATGNLVRGNLIGGSGDFGNWISGVRIDAASDNIIGGTNPGEGNVILGSFNDGATILGGAARNRVEGNRIGIDANGELLAGNGMRGVLIEDATSNVIGGTTPGAANIIAGNGLEGVGISAGDKNSVLGNSIFTNDLLGIDLGVDGMTPNDAGDVDAGPNGLQNFPVLTSVAATTTDVTIDGSISSKPLHIYRIEFFAGPSCDGSGHGEGERFLGFTSVAGGPTGTAAFNVVLPAAVGDGEAVTSTATDNFGTTSEFSACFSAVCSSTVVFGQTVLAQDTSTLSWSLPEDVRYAKGTLADVGSYSTTGGGPLFAATSLDISIDAPAPNSGLYYAIRPLACGSWQTTPGAEPQRDDLLP